MNFIEKTGLTDRVCRANAVQGAGMGVMFGSMVSGNPLLIPVGLLAFSGTMAYQWNAIKCPRCGYNLSWHAVTKVGAGSTSRWLQSLRACPQCHLGEEHAAPQAVLPETAVAPDFAPGNATEEAVDASRGVPLPAGAFAAPPAHAPWRLTPGALEKPAWSDYGIVESGRMIGLTRDELLRRFDHGGVALMVWTPETPRPTWFQNAPDLLARYRMGRMSAGRRGFWGPLAFFVIVLIGMLTSGEPLTLGGGAAFWLAGSALLLGFRLYTNRAALKLDAAAVGNELDDAWHTAWLRGRPARLTQVLMGGQVAVFAAQTRIGLEPSYARAAMIPAAVLRDGQWWRLLSYGVMHGGLLHIGLNLLAMWSLGKLMEVHANRALLSPVLLAGIAGGGLAGLVLQPGGPMVGVSGGLLGLIGFLTVVGFRRRDRVPHGFGAAMLKDVGFIAAVGLVGFRMIANAGHLGGLLAGLALGAVLVPRPRGEPRVGWSVAPVTAAIGWICTAVLVATCAATAVYLLLAPQ